MSLSNALSNAASGIAYASRATETVASNIANAQTPGYARRELQLSPRSHVSGGGGVQIDSVRRVVQQAVLAQHRLAAADDARASRLAAFASDMDAAFGVPGQPLALSTVLSEFDASLISATAHPESEAGLAQVVSRASDLAAKLNYLGSRLQDARTEAERDIGADVDLLNQGLAQVAELNRRISAQVASGGDATSLLDRRQALITDIAGIVPLQEMPRDNGRVALVTKGGALLLDGDTPLPISFSGAGQVEPGMQVGTPPLTRIAVDGVDLTAGQMVLFAGGSLAAAFTIRDEAAPGMQAQLDSVALDLHDRFADAATDPSLAAGQPGLFNDAGAFATPALATGLANRFSVNAAVVTSKGGAVWRLRDGMAAGAPGPVGSSAMLDAMSKALASSRPAGASATTATPRSAAGHVAELTTTVATLRLRSEDDASRTGATSSGLEDTLRGDGVDTDRELASLLNLERAYAANAKVLKAVDDMLLNILRLT